MKDKISIVLVDDHAIVRDGIKYLLEEDDKLTIIGEGSNGLEAIELVKNLQPDLLIIDVRMPEMSGIEALKIINSQPTTTKSIVLSMHDSEEYILESIDAKAMGYLLKDASKAEVLKAIYTVYQGEKFFSGDISNIIVNNLLKKSSSQITTPSDTSIPSEENSKNTYNLTKKEIEILQLVLLGKTNKEISEELNKSKRTIETHRFNLMKKMDVKNLIELSSKAKEQGFI
ncbi:two component transcriptional regulator, LuxR family [Lutibacter agarilyticus]|uniref:Two component transcriptional regulator, LuxR family n=1 Tax=Lutibacter agarilyticus TaxID=1109740 RepID=A0A238XU98_9FLAO|nr:response regulator transcription factor [Lutibacter agarilyticus]SNR62282.1 two component transcriptional regulator, LuxR family [Lutibacter agarilyticus]